MAKDTDAPALAKTFTDLVDKYGRSFEFGLATGYHLLNRPLAMLKMGPMGMSMFTRGRMALMPTKIRKIDQLQAIIKKAREIGRCVVKYAYYPGCSLECNARRLRRFGPRGGRPAGHQARRSSTTGTAAAPPSTSARTN